MTFIDMIAESSYSMFTWPLYYENENFVTVPIATATIQSMNLTESKILSIDEYTKAFENNNVLKELMQTIYPNLPEKYARSESANVKIALNFYRIDQNN